MPYALFGLSAVAFATWLSAGEIYRPERTTSTAGTGTGTTPAPTVGLPPPERATAAARIQAAREAATKTRELQATAASLARDIVASQKTGSNTWRINVGSTGTGLTSADVSGGLSENGLKVRVGGTWTGADAPVAGTSTSAFDHNIEIKQTAQQALLDWESFNIAPNTRLYFNQKDGAENVNNWIAFNRVGVTGKPSAILGRLDADGQVYVINPNGILFGGTSQVNAHALVASALPINENLVSRGLLNNPDAQFLFSGFAQNSGTLGPTAASKPKVTDLVKFPEVVAEAAKTFVAARPVSDSASTDLSVRDAAGVFSPLVKTTDYTQNYDAATGAASIALTDAGLAKVVGKTVEFNYTPSASSSGNVVVGAGAKIYSPTTGNNVGGRIALIGANVSNQGHVVAPDGQIVLAAGLEVGLAAHDKSDPSLRGVDVFVGRVTDSLASTDRSLGTATNGVETLKGGTTVRGLIETRNLERLDAAGRPDPVDTAGSIMMTGREIQQKGVVNSTTTVSFNGRIDLNASYNATPNPVGGSEAAIAVPFLYGRDGATERTGLVELGADSVTTILPSTSTTEKIARSVEEGVSLKSQINLTGKAIHLAGNSQSGATVIGTGGDIALNAGDWTVLNPANPARTSKFYRGSGQIYLDAKSAIDASGTQGAAASVTDFVVEAQLRGSELANSPLQRDGALRGQTVKVDSRVKGPWDPTLNNGAGGYQWVGTPLGNVSGWVNLSERTAEQLTTAGGTISLNAGDSVVVQKGSSLDVSGGWTQYAAGRIETSKVVSDGRVLDISQATPDKVYSGLFTGADSSQNATWGISETTANSVLLGYNDPGYWSGGNGGKLSVAADTLALDGEMRGKAFSGLRQTLVSPAAGAQSLVARPSQLVVKTSSETVASGLSNTPVEVAAFPANAYLTASSTLSSESAVEPFAYFADTAANYFLPEERRDRIDLSTKLFSEEEFGFLRLDVGNDWVGTNGRTASTKSFGNIYIDPVGGKAENTSLSFGSGSASGRFHGLKALDLTAANIYINGSISAPGSLLKFQATNFSASADQLNNQVVEGASVSLDTLTARANRGNVTMAAKATIDVKGLTLDQRAGGAAIQATQGGEVSLTGYRVSLGSGSAIDVSGGVSIGAGNSTTWGSAGAAELLAKNEQQFDGATLTLPATHRGYTSGTYLRGFSGTTSGGTLRVAGTNVQITPTAEPAATVVSSDPADLATRLHPDFFSIGGFSTFAVTGSANAKKPALPAFWVGETPTVANILTGWFFAPQAQQYLGSFTQNGALSLSTYRPAETGRASGVALNFVSLTPNTPASTSVPTNFRWEEHVRLELPVSTASELSILADEIDFLGQALVPAGRIGFQARSTGSGESTLNLNLGGHAALSTKGAVRSALDRAGMAVGSVLNGGRVSLSGNIVAQRGSIIDVSGASGQLSYLPGELGRDLDPAGLRDQRILETRSSSGGAVVLNGAAQLVFDGTLKANAGGAGAAGGSLTVSSGLLASGSPAPLSEPNLLVSQQNLYPEIGYTDANGKVLRRTGLTDAKGAVVSAIKIDGADYFGGRIAADSFKDGGFSQLTLGGRVKYTGAVDLSATSSVALATGGVLVADEEVASSLTVKAPYLALGTTYDGPTAANGATDYFPVEAKFGTGKVSLEAAKLLDVGTFALRGVGESTLSSLNGGDLRGYGGLAAAGKLVLRAGQIYAPTASDFVVAVDDAPGSVAGVLQIRKTGEAGGVPLSAGSNLSLFASQIDQAGVLRAPQGKIQLGTAQVSIPRFSAGHLFPLTQSVTLASTSVTSVSSMDYRTGAVLSTPIPYGVSTTGSDWIDPTGADISVSDPVGRTAKTIEITAQSVQTTVGSKVDLSGGGDLMSDRWVSGPNGTVNLLTASGSGFAILPDYSGASAPLGKFALGSPLLLGDSGYQSTQLKVGDSIRIDLGDGKGERSYQLLPARYALLPGAYWVNPLSGTVASGSRQADGSWVTGAYRFNAMESATVPTALYSRWEVLPTQRLFVSKPADGTTSKARSQFDLSYANTFFPAVATANEVQVRRLPRDAGQLIFSATNLMKLNGSVSAAAVAATPTERAGRGGEVDINSPGKIAIVGEEGSSYGTNTLVLKSSELNTFKTESLLIGGRRADGNTGTDVQVAASSVVVDNAGTPLLGSDLTLVASESVTIKAGSALRQTDVVLGEIDNLVVGDVATGRSGDGAALRVSSSGEASISRRNVSSSVTPNLIIESSAEISGSGVILDSTSRMTVAPDSLIGGNQAGAASALTLSATQIAVSDLWKTGADRNIVAGYFGIPDSSQWLFLSNEDLLRYARGSANSKAFGRVNLNSQRSIFAGAESDQVLGGNELAGLGLNARELRLFGKGGTTFRAGSIQLLNTSGSSPASLSTKTAVSSGILRLDAVGGVGSGLVDLGRGDFGLNGASAYEINSTRGVRIGADDLAKRGSLFVSSDLSMTAPVLAAESTGYQIEVAGRFDQVAPTGAAQAYESAVVGGKVRINASSISVKGAITAAAGQVSLKASEGGVVVNGLVDVSGRALKNQDTYRFASGGDISLEAAKGALSVGPEAVLNVAAALNPLIGEGHAARVGTAGSIRLVAPSTEEISGLGVLGRVALDGQLLGTGGGAGSADVDQVAGSGGRFFLDVGTLNGGRTADLAAIGAKLNEGGFDSARTLRFRSGDVTVSGEHKAKQFSLSADAGSISVTGKVDASGATGGSVQIVARDSVRLQNGSVVSVAAEQHSPAGKGGDVFLSAGATKNGVANSSALVHDASGKITSESALVDLAEGSVINLSVKDASFSVTPAANLSVAKGDVLKVSKDAVFTNSDGAKTTVKAGIPFAVPDYGQLTVVEAVEGTWLVNTSRGERTGTLHLRAPQSTVASNQAPDVQINPLAGQLESASSVEVEGYAATLLSNGSLDSVKASALASAARFGTAANESALKTRLIGGRADLTALTHVRPGVEIVSLTPGVEMNLATTWDLSSARYGASVATGVVGSGEAGFLTLRSAGDLSFSHLASLNDGFASAGTAGGLWQARLLPGGSNAWSYQLIAGSDTAAADSKAVRSLSSATSSTGSLIFGKGSPSLNSTYTRPANTDIIPLFFQTVRTGAGQIDLAASQDVRLVNPLFSLYSAGRQVSSPTRIFQVDDFDIPHTHYDAPASITIQHYRSGTTFTPYPAQYAWDGGSISISAGGDVKRLNSNGAADSTKQMPTNWLYRRGKISGSGEFDSILVKDTTVSYRETASTSWWVDYSNFFQDVGALGGGDVSIVAGGKIANVSAVSATNARTTKQAILPEGTSLKAADQRLVELGGGSVSLKAQGDVDGGVYYAEKGNITLSAGGALTSNATRSTVPQGVLNGLPSGTVADSITYLPTTFFVGKGSVNVTTVDAAKLGQVVNPFLLPQAINNSFYQTSFFSTQTPDSELRVTSLKGDVEIVGNTLSGVGTLYNWYNSVLYSSDTVRNTAASLNQPWLRLTFGQGRSVPYDMFGVAAASMLPSRVTIESLTGDVNIRSVSQPLIVAPSARGHLNVFAAGKISGLNAVGINNESQPFDSVSNRYFYGTASVIVSDADPARIPSPLRPEGYSFAARPSSLVYPTGILSSFNSLFTDSGATTGANVVLQTQLRLHGKNPNQQPGDVSAALHADDPNPMYLYANSGDVSGLSLISPKATRVVAGNDVSDVSFYLQNAQAGNVSLVMAGRDVLAYNPSSLERRSAATPPIDAPMVGDLQIAGPGSLQVIAGRDVSLGAPLANSSNDGTGLGIASIGQTRNPNLPFAGADVVVATGLSSPSAKGVPLLDFEKFTERYLNPLTDQGAVNTLASRYLPELAVALGLDRKTPSAQVWSGYQNVSSSEGAGSLILSVGEQLALKVFYKVLRDAGRDRNDPESPNFGSYQEGTRAISTLMPSAAAASEPYRWSGEGDLTLSSRSIRTTNGGDIAILAPGGGVALGRDLVPGTTPGIVTEYGGSINLLTNEDVDVGASRIFTLRGGDEVIWSSRGSIAAGVSSKTVQAAPPTRVLVDPQSADVKTDLAGLATGGGIGVLASVKGVEPGDVDLIAPLGVIDAGDAGIRSSGRLNVAAAVIRNAANISSGGKSSGVPPAPPAPNVGALASASNTVSSSNANKPVQESTAKTDAATVEALPSLVNVEVLGYGGDDEEEEKEKAPVTETAPAGAASP